MIAVTAVVVPFVPDAAPFVVEPPLLPNVLMIGISAPASTSVKLNPSLMADDPPLATGIPGDVFDDCRVRRRGTATGGRDGLLSLPAGERSREG